VDFYSWQPYVTVAERKRQAVTQLAKLKKKGNVVSPVIIEGRTIARTFWGKSWCDNLERYSDYESRLPRGRSYVRNGSVIDLKIARGEIAALVSGSEIYKVKITVAPAPQARWQALCKDCVGAIDSIVELLQGRLSQAVMERVCLPEKGLFPSPKEIELSCSCPDWAGMCKHVAAVLYGVGARLDASPELLFALRCVDHTELVSRAGEGLSRAKTSVSAKRVITGSDLASIFGLEMAESGGSADAGPAAAPAKKKAVAKKGKAPAAQLKTNGKAKATAKSAVLRAPAKRNSGGRTDAKSPAKLSNRTKSARNKPARAVLRNLPKNAKDMHPII
jgi:uncharacterized Zn finger protein